MVGKTEEDFMDCIEVDKPITPEIRSELQAKIETLKKLGISDEEIRQFVVNYLKSAGISAKVVAKVVNISEIGDKYKEKDVVSVRGKVLTLFEPNSDRVLQMGLISDGTGLTKFVLWNKEKSSVNTVRVGKTYLFKNMMVNKFSDNYQVESTPQTEVEEVSDLNLHNDLKVVTGVVTDVSGGLVTRCPVCLRTIDDKCNIHGEVTPLNDVELKLTVSTVHDDYKVIVREKEFARLTGFKLEDVITRAKKSLDRKAVTSDIAKYLLGRVVRVKGMWVQYGNYATLLDASVDMPDIKRIIVETLKNEL